MSNPQPQSFNSSATHADIYFKGVTGIPAKEMQIALGVAAIYLYPPQASTPEPIQVEAFEMENFSNSSYNEENAAYLGLIAGLEYCAALRDVQSMTLTLFCDEELVLKAISGKRFPLPEPEQSLAVRAHQYLLQFQGRWEVAEFIDLRREYPDRWRHCTAYAGHRINQLMMEEADRRKSTRKKDFDSEKFIDWLTGLKKNGTADGTVVGRPIAPESLRPIKVVSLDEEEMLHKAISDYLKQQVNTALGIQINKAFFQGDQTQKGGQP